MPVFTIIAGPNGAGKSTFSSLLSRHGALIFDPDAEKLIIEKHYPDISDDALESAITRNFLNARLRAIGSANHFTVESNLRNDFLLQRATEFRASGYETRIMYLLLPDLATSMDRVNLRVNQKGHFVDAESIKANFEKGIDNFLSMASAFDAVMLISGVNNAPEIRTTPELLLTFRNGLITQKAQIIPIWAQPVADRLIDKLKNNRFLEGPNR